MSAFQLSICLTSIQWRWSLRLSQNLLNLSLQDLLIHQLQNHHQSNSPKEKNQNQKHRQ